MYYCYLIAFTENAKIKRTYIGITNNLDTRLKRHNGILSGGAKSTRCSNKWFYHTIVSNFKSKGEAMSFESTWKNHSKSGFNDKMAILFKMLLEPKWKHTKLQL